MRILARLHLPEANCSLTSSFINCFETVFQKIDGLGLEDGLQIKGIPKLEKIYKLYL